MGTAQQTAYSARSVINVSWVRSNGIRGRAVVYCGKNTQMRRVIRELEEEGRTELEKVRLACKLNVALVFTNESLPMIRDMIVRTRRPPLPRPAPWRRSP